MTRLVVGYPAPLPVADDGTVVIDEKLRSGVARYRERWPGGDVVLAAPGGTAVLGTTTGLGARSRTVDELGFGLALGPSWRAALDAAAGDTYLLPLIPRLGEVQHLIDRAVLTVEFTPEDLTRTETQAADGLVSRARVRVGGTRRRRVYEEWVGRALGIQCNGYPAFERFESRSPAALLFFDTRLTAEHVSLARSRRRDEAGRPPRLCFSGRLIDAKGPQYAVAAAEHLRASGVDCTLDVIGVGPLEQELRNRAGPHVRFLEGMDFAQRWTSYVREEVDLMVLPHTQGDPSGTYLEAAGCGVPTVGFDNVALDSLVRRHGLGATAPLRDDVALARAAREVLDEPGRWASLRGNGLRFMDEHCFERESDRRVEHLASLSL